MINVTSTQDQGVFSLFEKAILVCLAIGSFGLGIQGYHQYYALASVATTASDLAYLSLNLFFMQFSAKGTIPLSLDIARWLAPATLSYAVIKAIMSLVQTKVVQFKINHLRNHAVIIGLNSRSVNIALSFRQNGIQTLVIDDQALNQYWGDIKKHKILHLVLNFNDTSLLENIKLSKANYLFASTQSDNTNLNIIYSAYCAKQKMPASLVLQTVCKIEDDRLLHASNERHLFALDHDNMSTRTLNYKLIAARSTVNEFGPHKYISDYSILSNLSILIAGENTFTAELVVRLAQIAIYGSPQKLRIILLGDSSAGIAQRITKTHPNITKIATIEVIASEAFLEEQYHSAILQSAVDIVYVCPIQTGEKLIMLQRFLNIPQNIPVVVCETQEQRSFEWLKTEFSARKNIKFVNINTAISHFEDVFESRLDQIAIIIHNHYRKLLMAKGETSEQNQSLVKWTDLPESLKNANRDQADHIAIKCHYLTGKSIATTQEIEAALTSSAKQALAQMEHQRWLNEKKLAGWQYTQGEKNVVSKLSPSLIEWDALPEKEKQKDIGAVEYLAELISLINKTKEGVK